MGHLQKKENRNSAQARNSFVTRKAETKLDALTDIFRKASGKAFVEQRRNTLQRTLFFEGFRYLHNLKFVYNWENRFMSVNYNLQLLNYVDVTEDFEEIGPCRFDMKFSMMRHKDDRFICRDWQGSEAMKAGYLERLNNPLIIERIQSLDINGVTIEYIPEHDYFRISMESLIGSSSWIFIPPVMQLIEPKYEECIRLMELYELLGDALVNNSLEYAVDDSLEDDNAETD